jgi:predicted metallo-beta-lactamase superfamily hydrolase
MNHQISSNTAQFLKIKPICSESYGVRSFCVKVTTPDISILLDPGCALGPFKEFKIPHKLEFERLHQFTNKIVNKSRECNFLFISHYHHDHFKPNLEDDMYIYSSQKLFKSLYTNKTVFCKQYRDRTNYNQKQRGEKLHQDLLSLNIQSHRVGVDKFVENQSLYQRNCSPESQLQISNSYTVGDTHLIFPREFLHGIRSDGKEIFIQPIIIIFKNEFFYFFPDVQGMPSSKDVQALILLKSDFESIYNRLISKNVTIHTIALGGPITYLLRAQNLNSILAQSLSHTQEIAKNFDRIIIDHHLIRDPQFMNYWKMIRKENQNISPFNPDLFTEIEKVESDIPVLEFNRELLFQRYS